MGLLFSIWKTQVPLKQAVLSQSSNRVDSTKGLAIITILGQASQVSKERETEEGTGCIASMSWGIDTPGLQSLCDSEAFSERLGCPLFMALMTPLRPRLVSMCFSQETKHLHQCLGWQGTGLGSGL